MGHFILHIHLDEIRKRIIQIFTEHSGYARTQDIRSSGIHHKYLQQLVEEGSIIKLKHGLYSLAEIDNYTVLQEALLTVPDGFICMGTALSFYELTTWNPPVTHIAIQRARKVVLPVYPPIKLYHISENLLTIGRTEVKMESGNNIAMYDRERVVCDAVRFRNRIGMDIMINPAASIQARLLNLSRKEKKDFVLISRLYMQEGILRRIGQSKYTESFYLKGGLLLY